MRGSPKGQARAVLQQIDFTEHKDYELRSRHVAKQKAREDGAKTSSEVAKRTGIYSYATRRVYQRLCAEFLQFSRENDGVKDAKKIEEVHVERFLAFKAETVKFSSLKAYASALNKFAVGLNKMDGGRRDWTAQIQAVKDGVDLEDRSFSDPKAYENPASILLGLDGDFRTLAELQLFGGLRVSEGLKITEKNLRGGKLYLTMTKGGRRRTTIQLPRSTYSKVAQAVKERGEFKVIDHQYSYALKKATEAAGEKWRGTHGLRWNYVQHRFEELQAQNGLEYEEALQQVALEIGHGRASITEWYLRR